MTTPIYDPNVPTNPSDSFAESQLPLLENFQALANSFLVNHVPLTDSVNQGNHTFVEMIEQTTDPQTGLNQATLYTKKVQGQTDQIFLRFQNNSTPIQLTAYQIYQVGTTSYFTFLPGNILLYFGDLPSTATILYLFPAVCSNIMSVSFFCKGALTNRDGYKPYVTLSVPGEDKIIRSVNIFQSNTVTLALPLSYLVVGNISGDL